MDERSDLVMLFKGVSPVNGDMEALRGLLIGDFHKDPKANVVLPGQFGEDCWLAVAMPAASYDGFRTTVKGLITDQGSLKSFRKVTPSEVDTDTMTTKHQEHPWVEVEVIVAPRKFQKLGESAPVR